MVAAFAAVVDRHSQRRCNQEAAVVAAAQSQPLAGLQTGEQQECKQAALG